MPRLTSQREALLLITPHTALGDITQLQVTVSVNGISKGTLSLRHPNAIPHADYAPTDSRPDYVYSLRAWTGVLPWDWVQPGLELRVVDNQNRSGSLAANKIDFAAPGELVVQSIRIGMLTAPQVDDSKQWFRSHPVQAATDYFQTIPAARMVASYYEDVTLPRVMVASGVIYDTASAGEGGIYAGDMRENTAKSTFSVGINMANYGVTSSGMQSQSQPQVFQTATIHHAQGMYSNGLQPHGLSGGNSILTLSTSKGNEFSHEIGHHYGLGHYPGWVTATNDSFLAVHHHDSGWGYIAYRKRMRANLLWNSGSTCTVNGAPSAMLDKLYCFAPDAMSGGSFISALSLYTHYTGYSTTTKIQPAMDKPVLTPSSPTGYQKWNTNTRAMENYAPPVPAQPTVWFNSASGKFLPPAQHGVPVITLLGGYDPRAASAKALMYPALRGNWGNVFNLPTHSVSAATDARQCWLQVSFANGKAQQRIALAGSTVQSGSVNKFHVNLAQSDKPSQAGLYCQTTGQAEQNLGQIDIPTNLADMPVPAIVGKEAGSSALRKIELPTLDAALQALAAKNALILSTANRVLYDSYADYAQELSAAGQLQLKRYADQQEKGLRLNRWISSYASALEQQNAQAQNALLQFIATLGLRDTPLIPVGQTLTMANGSCIQKSGDGVRVAGKALCTGDANEQWIQDARGAIRSRADLNMCITYPGNASALTLATCDVNNDLQVWDTSVAKRISRNGSSCFDLYQNKLDGSGIGVLSTYGCGGGANQSWGTIVQSQNVLLTLLSGKNAQHLGAIADK